MNTIKTDKKNTLMIAHRGLNLETENTCAAFICAGNRSYYGIETDIYKTLDGNFICHHDNNTKRTAGENLEMESCSLSVYRSIVLFDKDGSKNRTDLRIPTLENYLTICKKYEKKAIIELKSSFSEQEIVKITEICKKYSMLENAVFIAFEWDNLAKVKQLLPNQPVQFLTCEYTDDLPEKLASAHMDVDIHYAQLTEERIKAFHEKGITVNCWTVDDKDVAEKLVLWGVDQITSNILE